MTEAATLPVAPCHHGNPAAVLEQAFVRIAAERMAGVPLCNPALRVAVVGMTDWQGEWVGTLLTPWALSLVILPGPGGRFRPLRVGETQDWDFPSGHYEFLGSSEPGLGPYQSCSLYSPVFEFGDQAAAVAVAEAACAALFQPVEAPPVAQQAEAARLAGAPLADQPLSRRAFLGGGLFGKRG